MAVTPDTHARLIHFDEAFDGTPWPGPVGIGQRDAAFGVDWVGRAGLINLLENELGLTGDFATATERAGDLCRRLENQDGFWRASFEADQLGTCRRLLADRDALAESGWNGQSLSERLDEIWRVTANALPGTVDRLLSICEAVQTLPTQIRQITLSTPVSERPPLWRRLFGALERQGVAVLYAPLHDAPTTAAIGSDLADARTDCFLPVGDGRLALFRPHGVLAAADEVAAALANAPSRDGIVIIGADSILDAALKRHGLPRLGAHAPEPATNALVRLVLETAFEPMDPADLHGLLCLDPGPIPRGLAHQLTRALQSFPARGTDKWKRTLDTVIAKQPEAKQAAVERRLRALLAPIAKRDENISIEQVAQRLNQLTAWAMGRAKSQPELAAVAEHASRVLRLADMMGAVELSRDELRRLCDEAPPRSSRSQAEAGLAHVASPGAVHGPAESIIWWDFTRALAPTIRGMRLSNAEKRAIAEAGMEVPRAADRMMAEAARWRRPLHQAKQSLLLVCPLTDSAGKPSYPHPLWDELCAAIPEDSSAATLEVDHITFPSAGQQERAALQALPVPQTQVQASQPLGLRERGSPSSLNKLLGCSLGWALRYYADVGGGLSSGPPDTNPLLYGRLAHELLAKVFQNGCPTPEEAAAQANRLVEVEGPRLAEALDLPRYQGERATFKRAVVESARDLAARITDLGAEVAGVEFNAEGEHDGLALGGRVDMLLKNPAVVIDLKWGKGTAWGLLQDNAALQLAAYAELCNSGGERPAIGYYVISKQLLLTGPDSPIDNARHLGSATASEIWQGAVAAVAARKAELAEGVLVAPRANGSEGHSYLGGDKLNIEAPCTYCEFTALCGLEAGL